jgi:phage shock protein E
LLFLLIGGLFVVGCSSLEKEPELAFRLVKEEEALLVDVRTPSEYAERRLEGAKNIPIDQLSQKLYVIEALSGGNKSRPVVVYCAAGGRASRAKQLLEEAGFEQVVNLGGIKDWPGSR